MDLTLVLALLDVALWCLYLGSTDARPRPRRENALAPAERPTDMKIR